MNAVEVGQVWQEVDPRITNGRFVEIVEVKTELRPGHGSRVRRMEEVPIAVIRRVERNGALAEAFERTNRKVFTKARLDRFNGKRGGYRFVQGKVDGNVCS